MNSSSARKEYGYPQNLLLDSSTLSRRMETSKGGGGKQTLTTILVMGNVVVQNEAKASAPSSMKTGSQERLQNLGSVCIMSCSI